MRSDIEIAQAATLKPISTIAEQLDIPSEALIPYGHYIAKLDRAYTHSLQHRPNGKLILVTAISPTPAGEGKRQRPLAWLMLSITLANALLPACVNPPWDQCLG